MTPGERQIASWPKKTSFHDAHERRAYLRMVQVASRLIDDATLLQRGRAFLERHSRGDPHQRAAYEVWDRLLEAAPEEIARALLADTEEGALLRDTAPVFVVIPSPLP